MTYTIITYWWGRGKVCKNSKNNYLTNENKAKTYDELANEWKNQMKKLKIKYYIEEIPRFSQTGKYQEAIAYKPIFIKKCLNKLKTPVVYMDMDMKIHKQPLLFENNYFDIMMFNWNSEPRISDETDFYTLETSGGISYFNTTKTSKKILDLWLNQMNKHKGCADDRLFSMMFKQCNVLEWCKCYWLPMEYFYIPQFEQGLIKESDIVISHPYEITTETEATKLGAAKNRIPKQYNKIIKTSKTENLKEHYNIYFEFTLYKKVFALVNQIFMNKNVKTYNKFETKNMNIEPQKKYKIINEPIDVTSILKMYEKTKFEILHIQTDKKHKIKYAVIDELDFIFDKDFKIMYWRPSINSLCLLKNINDFKKRKNISYIMGLRYLIT